MVISGRDRVRSFVHRHARAQASDVVDLGWGFALLQQDFPLSYEHNHIVVTEDAAPPEILSVAEEVFSDAGLEHRRLSFDDTASLTATQPEFLAAGFRHEPTITMIHDGRDLPTPIHDVSEISFETLRPALIRTWQQDLPDASDEAHRQLADRTELYANGADTTFLAVMVDDEVAANACLFIDPDDGVAQFENLTTDPRHRGTGFATALIGAAAQRVKQAGCDLLFLSADEHDWPRTWYQRLGFVDASRTDDFQRSPATV